MLKEIKSLLGIELSAEVEEVNASEEVATEETKVELAQITLENGTVLEAEEFAPDFEVFIITEEDKIAVPVGEYTMEDGQILVVEEEGIIKEIKSEEAPAEEEAPEAEVEVEAAEEEMAYVSKEEFSAAVEEIKAMIEELKSAKEEMAAQEAVEAQIKEELSATPAAAPLKHNPEGEAKKQQFLYAQNRSQSTRDRVLARIANFK